MNFFRAYHIIVQESSSLSKSPDEWLPSQLGPYDATTYKTGKPYVTAVLSSYATTFVIGDGREYKVSRRKRRNIGSGTYKNVPLKPNTEYHVFQRAYISQVCLEIITNLPFFLFQHSSYSFHLTLLLIVEKFHLKLVVTILM